MKETGIVRRIDELGRVVIPKEMRRTLRLKEGDPMEIFAEQDMLCLKKYSPVSSIKEIADSLTESLAEMTGKTAFIVDTEKVLSAKGQNVQMFLGKLILPELRDVLDARRSVVIGIETSGSIKRLFEQNDVDFNYILIVPTVVNGDIIGGVLLCGKEEISPEEIRFTTMCSGILLRQF